MARLRLPADSPLLRRLTKGTVSTVGVGPKLSARKPGENGVYCCRKGGAFTGCPKCFVLLCGACPHECKRRAEVGVG